MQRFYFLYGIHNLKSRTLAFATAMNIDVHLTARKMEFRSILLCPLRTITLGKGKNPLIHLQTIKC